MAAQQGRRDPFGGHATDCDGLIAWLETVDPCDDRGRITPRTGPGAMAGGRLHLGRTRHGTVWRLAASLPASVATRLSRLAAREPPLPPGPPPWPAPERAGALLRVLEADPARVEVFAGAVLRLPSSPALRDRRLGRAGDAERLDPARPDAVRALREALPDVAGEAPPRGPLLVARENGRIVSAAWTASGDPAGCAVLGIATAPAARRRGHAARLAAAWLAAVSAAGGTPLYAARWGDAAALGLADALGLEAFADVLRLA